jgi:hypothetical protein
MTGDTQDPEDGVNHVVSPSDASGAFEEVTELLHADASTVSADRVHIEQSSARTVTADDVVIDQSAIKEVTAQSATITQSASLLFRGGDVALVHIGPTEGPIKPVLDAQSAVALGAGFGATLIILSRLLRRLFGN